MDDFVLVLEVLHDDANLRLSPDVGFIVAVGLTPVFFSLTVPLGVRIVVMSIDLNH